MISEIGIGAIVVAWLGSLELRIKNHVGRDRFQDLKDDMGHVKDQTLRIEKKIDAFLVFNNIEYEDDKE